MDKLQQPEKIRSPPACITGLPPGLPLHRIDRESNDVMKLGGIAAVGGMSLAALSLLLAPAIAATSQDVAKKPRPAPHC